MSMPINEIRTVAEGVSLVYFGVSVRLGVI